MRLLTGKVLIDYATVLLDSTYYNKADKKILTRGTFLTKPQ